MCSHFYLYWSISFYSYLSISTCLYQFFNKFLFLFIFVIVSLYFSLYYSLHLFGLVLWHINPCSLFNAKSCLYFTTVKNFRNSIIFWVSSWRNTESDGLRNHSKRVRTPVVTFGKIPLGKIWTPLSSQLWVKKYHDCSSNGMALALNNLQRLICHKKRNQTKPKVLTQIYKKYFSTKIFSCFLHSTSEIPPKRKSKSLIYGIKKKNVIIILIKVNLNFYQRIHLKHFLLWRKFSASFVVIYKSMFMEGIHKQCVNM